MLDRVPIPREARPPLPDFTPVPRKRIRHDGWTPERQKAFIGALADTGCVSRAARMVNMSPESAYLLRRQPGAESFRRAWEAALDFGVARLKDIAFERAIEGQLVPVFVAGKLMGFRRKKNDRLLMFCLRHYGQDALGRRVTINYFSSKASAAAAPATGEAAAEASATTVRTTISGPEPSSASIGTGDDERAAILNGFEGVELDEQAQLEIERSLAACAERLRALPDSENPEIAFVSAHGPEGSFLGELESGVEEAFIPFREGELGWEGMGEGGPNEEIERAVAAMQARLAAQSPEQLEAQAEAARRDVDAERGRPARLEPPGPVGLASNGSEDPRLDWRNWETGAYAPPANPPEDGEEEEEGGGDDEREAAEPGEVPISPRTGKALRRYRKRRPKPPFTGPIDVPPGPRSRSS